MSNFSIKGETITTRHELFIDPNSIRCPFKFKDDAKRWGRQRYLQVRKYAKNKEWKKEKWKRFMTAVQVSDPWKEREKSKENMSDINIHSSEVGPGKQKVLKWQSPFGVFSNFAGRDLPQYSCRIINHHQLKENVTSSLVDWWTQKQWLKWLFSCVQCIFTPPKKGRSWKILVPISSVSWLNFIVNLSNLERKIFSWKVMSIRLACGQACERLCWLLIHAEGSSQLWMSPSWVI